MIEITTFRLVEGADPDEFVEVDKRFQQAVAYQQPGLARRTTARGEGGEWVVVRLWWTEPPADPPLPDLVDPASVRTTRYVELE